MIAKKGFQARAGPKWLRRWPVLFGLWTLFAGEWTWQLAVWGAVASLVAVVAADLLARRGVTQTHFAPRWISELGPAAVAVVTDFGVLIAVLARSLRMHRRAAGVFLWDESAAGKTQSAAGRRAWVETVATWSPNCYVIDIDADSGRRLIHDLRPRRASELPT